MIGRPRLCIHNSSVASLAELRPTARHRGSDATETEKYNGGSSMVRSSKYGKFIHITNLSGSICGLTSRQKFPFLSGKVNSNLSRENQSLMEKQLENSNCSRMDCHSPPSPYRHGLRRRRQRPLTSPLFPSLCLLRVQRIGAKRGRRVVLNDRADGFLWIRSLK
jgi:hypothetical protein